MSPVASDRAASVSTARRLDPTLPFIGRLQQAHAKHGDQLPSFNLTLEDGSTHTFGEGEPAFEVTINSRGGRAAVTSFDETRICEAYMAGALDLEGDMLALMRMRPLFSDRHPLQAMWNKILHPLVFGQVRSDEKWIAEHYDEDPEFYRLFLDRRMAYSQAVYESEDEPLDDAIERKLDFALDAVGVGEGDRVLDIGAGWGAMTAYAGGRGIRVTSLTISEASEDHVQGLIAEHGLPCQVVRQHLLAYENGEPFDAVVNLGVTEHLPDYPATLAKYAELLKPGGRVYLDASAARTKFGFSSFIYRHIFPGNATAMCLHDYLAAVADSPFDVVAVYNDRKNYELTCRAWAENLERGREEIERRWGKQLFRRFQLYLWGSTEGMMSDKVGAYRVVLELKS